jgi:hypothetical protein
MADAPAPYPPHRRGERYRMLAMPVASPDRTPAEPAKPMRRDGRPPVPLWRTLPGLAAPAERSPDEMVTDWQAWP